MKIFYQTFGTVKKKFSTFLNRFFKKKKTRIGIYGPPNAGKTTLANRIARDWTGDAVGPVSEIPHETRRARKKEDIIISGANGNTITIDIVDTPGVTTKIDYHEFLEFGMEKEESIIRAREATEGVAEAMHWLREDIDGVVYMLDSTHRPVHAGQYHDDRDHRGPGPPGDHRRQQDRPAGRGTGPDPERVSPAPRGRDLGARGQERRRPLRYHARILRVKTMPHKCTKCGREYKDGSTEILKGCASCGNKKFLYVKEAELNKDVLEEKSIEEIADESHEEILEVAGARERNRWRCTTGSRRSGSSPPDPMS